MSNKLTDPTDTVEPTDPLVAGVMVVNSVTGASPFYMESGNDYEANFTGLTTPPPVSDVPVQLNIQHTDNQLSVLAYGASNTPQIDIQQNGTSLIQSDAANKAVTFLPNGGTVNVGTTVNGGSLTVNGETTAQTLKTTGELKVEGSSGASAGSLDVTDKLSVTGAEGATTGALNVTGAAGASTGTLNVTDKLSVTGAEGASTGALNVTGAAGASTGTLNVTDKLSVTGAEGATTGTLSVTGAAGASTGTLNVTDKLSVTGAAGASTGTLNVTDKLNVTGAEGATANGLNISNGKMNINSTSSSQLNISNDSNGISQAESQSSMLNLFATANSNKIPVIYCQTSPESKLDIGPGIALGHKGEATGRQFFILSTGSKNIGGAGLFQIADQTANQSRLVINEAGNVGINTTSPSATLDVNGAINCTTFTQSSDVRFKKEIEPLGNVMSKLDAIQGVSFDWKTEEFPEKNFNDKRQIGLLAQEIEKTFPELLHTDNKGYKHVDYTKFSAILLEATKEQQSTIDQLSAQLSSLNKRLNELEASVN